MQQMFRLFVILSKTYLKLIHNLFKTRRLTKTHNVLITTE